ncbi:zonular occludens toxin family protein [Colwellia sp. 20A7]|uniref:zonular occludens toxin family protein n=1 Tax=Colwellia sp. 20A7 TaxID=2689569 RepID=UPI0013585446|nr:zonular occludens toxin domain-containing protein [Colwellia sp. 20A7]
MATKVFHGPPGSYKSSSAVWFDVLPALRSGRVVVTNVQGMKTLEEIQQILGEVFPNTSRLLRISIGNESGMILMRNFFHWLPIGAMIFIDEVQDIYPNDKSFKAADYDYVKEGQFDSVLPQDFIEIYHSEQRKIKDNVNIDDYLDDIGESLFDERGYLRYPRTLRECFMRHRHYNWDILLATPDIKEVSGFIRSVCEVAYCHSSKDAIPIPYFKRRPRVLEHLPKSNGTTVGKNDIKTFRKIPVTVFGLYQSTATGKNTKSGVGQSPFSIRLLFGFACIIAYILYMVFFFFDDDGDKVDKDLLNPSSSTLLEDKKLLQETKKNNKKVLPNDYFGSKKDSNVTYRDASVSTITSPNNFVALPFGASKIYLNAVNTVYHTKHKVSRDYVFTVDVKGERMTVSSDILLSMGYKIFYKSSCMVELRGDDVSTYVYCEPRKSEKQNIESESVQLSIL